MARWWADDPALEAIEADYGPGIDGHEPCEVFIAHRDGVPLGLAQRLWLHDYPRYVADIGAWTPVPAGACSIDYLLGNPGALQRGLGTELVGAFTSLLWRDRAQAAALLVPVHAGNRASWRVLERNGYTLAARAELDPDNPADSRDHVIYRIDRP